MRAMRWMLAAAMVSVLASGGRAQAPPADERMDWWREARFGLFIHWGLYAIPAGEWEGRTDHAEWIRTTAQIPVDRYDQFLKEFNPTRFDADAWCRVAKAAGMRYIVITSKHHDGFALFDSKVSEFDVMATPLGRDILAELAAACERHGLRLCFYHSIMDWHHPDYLPRRDWERARRPEGDADFGRFVAFLHAQVRELLTRYGPIGVMWFDGEWESTWTRELGNELYDLCRSIQPSVIVNNRVSKGRDGMAGLTRGEGFAGDFGTPEQEVPSTGLPGVDWETCMTMNRYWGWNRSDTEWKSPETLVRTLVDVASKGGNFLLNVGPRADGTFPDEAIERLEAVGAWMAVNGESIYGTSASPFESLPWGRCTMRRRDASTTLYLHVFDWPEGGVLEVPGITGRVLGARVLGSTETVDALDGEGNILLRLPDSARRDLCTVVALEMHGQPTIRPAPRITAASTQFIGLTPITIDARSDDVELRYTLDGSTPTAESRRTEGGVVVGHSVMLRVRGFQNGRAVTPEASMRLERVEPWPAIDATTGEPGLRDEVYRGEWSRLPEFDRLTPASVGVATSIAPLRDERVGRRLTGLLPVPLDAVYRFDLTSDDGARLWIDGRLIVDNDGLHEAQRRSGEAPLAAGWHRITVEWFNRTGEVALELRIAPAGGEPVLIDGRWLRQER